MNHFLQPSLTDAAWFALQALQPQPSPFTTSILLDQTVVAGVPPVDFSLLYADATRLNVASQSFPTQQLAYLSDIPAPPPIPDQIVAPDNNATVVCSNGGVTQIINQATGIPVFSSSVAGETTVMGCPNGTAYVSCNDTGSLDIKSDYDLKLLAPTWQMNGVAYPPTDGQANQVWMTSGTGNVQWQNCPGIFSQTVSTSAVNTNAETNLLVGGYGNSILSLNLGDVISFSASGTFRNSSAAQNLRLRLYTGVTLVWDSGAFGMSNLAAARPWSIQFSMHRNPNLITNGGFTYRTTSDAIVGLTQETTAAYVPQAMRLTVQWGTASVNNSFICTRITVSRLY